MDRLNPFAKVARKQETEKNNANKKGVKKTINKKERQALRKQSKKRIQDVRKQLKDASEKAKAEEE